jgi:hypothetical protein
MASLVGQPVVADVWTGDNAATLHLLLPSVSWEVCRSRLLKAREVVALVVAAWKSRAAWRYRCN